MNLLSPPFASQVARSLGHFPGPWRDHGVMRSATCQRCGAVMVERVDDGLGVTGAQLERKCEGKA